MGTVWHWSLNSTDVFDETIAWTNEGAAVNASGVQGSFDAVGVFTPGMVRECDDTNTNCTWYLFYGGNPSTDNAHAENVGVAIATSPWYFERSLCISVSVDVNRLATIHVSLA